MRHDSLLEELKDWKPDLIHIHTEGSVARMARAIAAEDDTPFLMTSHTDYAQYVFGRFCKTPPAKLITSEWGKFGFKGASVIIAPSEKALSFPQLKSVLPNVIVVPNGIKTEHFQIPVSPEERAELFAKTGFPDNGKTIVIVSRLSKEKNIKEIIRFMPSVLKELPDAHLIIVGDGPDRQRLESLTEKLELTESVCFTGRIPPDDVYKYYNLGDVFVSASTFEVHSLTYLEAMACGVPLVCRDDPCLAGVLMNGYNGFTFTTEEEFTESVVKILSDRELHDTMKKNALITADDFSEKRYVDRVLAVYEKVLGFKKDEQPAT